VRRHIWKVLAGLVGVFVLAQLVPYRVDNPKARDEPKWDSPATRALAKRACYDCHSNETHVLAFEQVAPLSWWITNHVKEGRSAVNFSTWHTKAGEHAGEPGESVSEGGMPPSYYHWFGLHSGSKLTPAEVKALLAGLQKTVAADPPKGGGGGG